MPEQTLQSMRDKPDGINEREHPNPLALETVPDEQLLEILVDEYVDGIVEGDGFVDGVDGGVDGQAVVGRVLVQDVDQDVL